MSARTSYLVLTLIAIGVVAALGAWHLGSGADEPTPVPETSAVVQTTPSAAPPVVDISVPAPVSVSPNDVARWSEDAVSGDASRRVTAITGLAKVPTAQALPVLRRVLVSGEPAVDRPLALASIRELALDRGDADGSIRAVVREAIYHADDFSNVAATQDVLDVIEESEMK